MLIVPTLESPASDPLISQVRQAGSRDLLAIGDLLADTYEVRAKLGEGGMGQVYEAWDRTLGRQVAIKAVAPEGKASLGNEARALAALRHPSIVVVHGVGEHRGIPYVVMERVPGRTLQAHLDSRRSERKRFGIEEVLEILHHLAEALAVVHAAGIAHRDVKPANVMLAPGDRIVLTDFGIFQPEIEAVDGLHFAGSPHYMAPEAIAGKVDSGELYLVDVYSLGVVAYELLTGRVPYDDVHVMKVLWMHATAPVPDPRAVRHDAPARLVSLMREMLAKDPKDRPQGMNGIAWQLRAMRTNPRGNEQRCSVLIVEDNAATALIISSIVEEAWSRAEVRVARDGRTALDMIRHEVPDLLVVDLHLPEMSGVELCRLLASTPAADWTTVVATSSDADAETLRLVGPVEYVPKGEALATRLPAFVRAAARRSVGRVGR